MAEPVKLPKPIEIDIPGYEAMTFRTFGDIEIWAGAEMEAWRSFQDEPPGDQVEGWLKFRPREHFNILEEIYTTAQIAASGAPVSGPVAEPTIFDALRESLAEFDRGERPYSLTSQGQFILATWQKDPNLAAAMLDFLNKQRPADQGLITAIRAGTLLSLHGEGAIPSASEEKRALAMVFNPGKDLPIKMCHGVRMSFVSTVIHLPRPESLMKAKFGGDHGILDEGGCDVVMLIQGLRQGHIG